MASSIPASNAYPSTREPCRFFLMNKCRYGDRCLYSHGQPTNICRYFLQGKCTYGDQCRFAHPQAIPSPRSVRSPPEFWPSTETTPSNAPMNRPAVYYNSSMNHREQIKPLITSPSQSLCPHTNQQGYCHILRQGRACSYLHWESCGLCQMPALHPTDRRQRERHQSDCSKKREAKREENLAIERSREKTCGVCLEIVWNKEKEKRFGLLENCDHVFCLSCIRTWRSLSTYERQVVKACPECRTKSDFVTPTKYWPKDNQAKADFIKNYKETLQKIHCKHFQRGQGTCPFGSKCFYLHVDKDGKPVQLAPPRRRRARMNLHGALDDLADLFMISVFSEAQMDRFLDGWDFLFNDDDDDDDEDDDEDADENEDILYQPYFMGASDSSDEEDEFLDWD